MSPRNTGSRRRINSSRPKAQKKDGWGFMYCIYLCLAIGAIAISLSLQKWLGVFTENSKTLSLLEANRYASANDNSGNLLRSPASGKQGKVMDSTENSNSKASKTSEEDDEEDDDKDDEESNDRKSGVATSAEDDDDAEESKSNKDQVVLDDEIEAGDGHKDSEESDGGSEAEGDNGLGDMSINGEDPEADRGVQDNNDAGDDGSTENESQP